MLETIVPAQNESPVEPEETDIICCAVEMFRLRGSLIHSKLCFCRANEQNCWDEKKVESWLS